MGSFQLYFELIGAVAFAVSGAALGIRKGMDLFGVVMPIMATPNRSIPFFTASAAPETAKAAAPTNSK